MRRVRGGAKGGQSGGSRATLLLKTDSRVSFTVAFWLSRAPSTSYLLQIRPTLAWRRRANCEPCPTTNPVSALSSNLSSFCSLVPIIPNKRPLQSTLAPLLPCSRDVERTQVSDNALVDPDAPARRANRGVAASIALSLHAPPHFPAHHRRIMHHHCRAGPKDITAPLKCLQHHAPRRGAVVCCLSVKRSHVRSKQCPPDLDPPTFTSASFDWLCLASFDWHTGSAQIWMLKGSRDVNAGRRHAAIRAPVSGACIRVRVPSDAPDLHHPRLPLVLFPPQVSMVDCRAAKADRSDRVSKSGQSSPHGGRRNVSPPAVQSPSIGYSVLECKMERTWVCAGTLYPLRRLRRRLGKHWDRDRSSVAGRPD